MFAFHRITSPQSPAYPLAERLLTSSFPSRGIPRFGGVEEVYHCVSSFPSHAEPRGAGPADLLGLP